MTALLLVGLLAVGLVSFGRWRWGLLLCPLVGFAQDPIRKILPGRPVVLAVVVAGVVGVCLVSALQRGGSGWLRSFAVFYPKLRIPLVLFTVVVVLQAVRTMLLYGNRTMAGIGLLGYLSPTAAVAAFYLLARDWRQSRRWLAAYVALAALAGATVVLHFLGVDSRFFDSIALDSVYGVGRRVQMYCGILRSSEFAAFHSATAACIALAWASGVRRPKVLVPVGLLTSVLLLAVLVSGRRKMLAQFALFLVLFLFLEARARGSRGRVLTAVAALGIAVGILAVVSAREGTSGDLQPYLLRGGSVVGESVERLTMMTVGAFSGVFANVGFFGAGAGIASQGTQYYNSSGPVIWSNPEGGLGRVMVELGVPGLALLIALGWATAQALRNVARFAARLDAPDSHLVLGLVAILPSNAAVFVSAQQLYGDPFVLIVLGAIFGLALGFPPAKALELRAGYGPPPAPARPTARGPKSGVRSLGQLAPAPARRSGA